MRAYYSQKEWLSKSIESLQVQIEYAPADWYVRPIGWYELYKRARDSGIRM